jgi:lipoteichoic acid synthase
MLDKLRQVLNFIETAVLKTFSEIRINYGVLGLAAVAAAALKLFLFYVFIGVKANFFLVWLITAVLTCLLFTSFKNKWIPAVIYMLLSILMFCDVTYSSFFNRYLSVNMMGAAGFLGDISESIKAVLKPWFFLMLADGILVLAALAVRTLKFKKPDTSLDSAVLEETSLTNQRARRAKREKQRRAKRWLKEHKQPVAALLIVLLLVFNVSGNYLLTSLSNQEIYTYHIKDLLNKATGNALTAGSDSLYELKDSYETEKNGPLFGIAKGKNLIVIQIESLQNLVIGKTYNGQEITPNLNQIIKGNTIYFDHYYQQIGSGNTSDAEFATNNSIYGTIASYTYKLYANNYFRGLPKLLKEKGYETAVYHAHEDRSFWNRENAYPGLGFDTYYGGIGGHDKKQYEMTEWMGWGLTDSEFFKQSMPFLKDMKQPFYSFMITLSNHHPFQMLDKYRFINLLPKDKGTIFGNYLNSAAYTDYAIGQFIQELKDEGLYDNSLIAFYGDHAGLPKSDDEISKSVSRFLGKDYDFDSMMNIPLIITVPGADRNINQKVSTVGGQLDFMPTIAYLMGFDKLDTVYMGHNLLTEKSGFVIEQTYMTKGSFISDDIIYDMSRDGVFENGRAWNPKTGEAVPLKDCYEGYKKATGLINRSEYILRNDILRKIYLKDKDAEN